MKCINKIMFGVVPQSAGLFSGTVRSNLLWGNDKATDADCEEALKESTQKFSDRFCRTEALILADGKKMQELSAEELWAYYERAKRNG